MKKAIKILSILCAILVAVFTATFFNSYKVSANDEITKSFYYENIEINFIYYNNQPNVNIFYTIDENLIQNSVDSDQDFTLKINNTLTLTRGDNLKLDDSNPYTDGVWLVTFIINNELDIEDIEKIEIVDLKFWLYNENNENNIIYEKYIQNIKLPKTIYEDIFNETTGLLAKIVKFFTTAISTIISLFWVSGTGLTIYGKLFLIPAGFSVFYKIMKWIGRLIRIR